jgi:two-component system cell cycle sensor histidine kinase/response regulator CckA
MVKVLVVDDDAPACSLAARIIREAGYDVVMTTSVSRALGYVDAGEMFDLAVLDVVMPEMTGDVFAAALRRRQPDVPVLFVTGFADELFKAQRLLAERQSFLEKPYSVTGLLEAVAMALHGSPNAQPRQSQTS